MSKSTTERPGARSSHHNEVLSDAEYSAQEQSRLHAAAGDLRGTDGDFRGALKEYQKAARLEPDSTRRLNQLAEAYAAADQPEKAIEIFQRALLQSEQGGEELTDTYAGLGDICRTFAMSAKAIRSYERAVRSRPRQPFLRWKLAAALVALGLFERAEEQLLTVLELAPRDAYYRFQLADLYYLMARHDDAAAQMREVVALAPFDEYYRLRLGAALLQLERASEALPHFERAVELQTQNGAYRALLRYAQTRNGEEPPVALEVQMIELSAYDRDFVRRIRRLAEAAPNVASSEPSNGA
jgi:tetratricopeptide (TPR) repeat protein